MKQVICAVRDSAADVFGRPYFVPTAGVAIRSFTDEVNRGADDNQFYKHPKDFAKVSKELFIASIIASFLLYFSLL